MEVLELKLVLINMQNQGWHSTREQRATSTSYNNKPIFT